MKEAKNFIRKRGIEQFRYLIGAFERNLSGQEIANHLGVSRERVRQWKVALGTEIVTYQPSDDTKRILAEGGDDVGL